MSRKLALAVGLPAAYLLVARPWMLRWGASAHEVRAPLPGDDLLPPDAFQATRALTIGAPPQAVWPWLVQMGYGRGGFYSYDRLDHGGVPSARRILPEFQYLRAGDHVRLHPDVAVRVARLDPNRALVWFLDRHPLEFGLTASMVMAYTLSPLPGDRSRLVVRVRGHVEPRLPGKAYLHLLFEPVDFLMMRRQMLGLRERAERPGGSP